MADRAVVAKIDAGIEKPGERKFVGDFRADTLAQRPALVAAGLTLLRGYIVAERPWPKDITNSRFTDWDRLVRGCLLWLREPDPYATKELVMSTDSARESSRRGHRRHHWNTHRHGQRIFCAGPHCLFASR